jgi:GTP-binding protein Era
LSAGRAALPAPRAGIVTLVGRPNAGKSTLLNRLLGEKLAIVSDRPQTTRHRLVGILTEPRGQLVLLDTPGVHRPLHRMNLRMVREATDSLSEADAVCMIVDASQPFGGGDRYLLELVSRSPAAKVVALNKIDLVRKPSLLPRIAIYAEGGGFGDIVPVSARNGDGVDRLLEVLWGLMPAGEPLYDTELLTVHPERFLVAERIREKLLHHTRDELPFTTAVLIEDWQESDTLLRLHATILVERAGQKKIVVGKGGSMLKKIGQAARLDLEEYLDKRVYLELFVRHEPDWRENRRLLARLDRDLHPPV